MVARARDVSPIVVTRGDVDLEPVLAPLRETFGHVVIWNNGDGSRRHDLSVYGRYEAILNTTARLVFVQDDDCVLPPESIAALVALWQPGYVVCNMPERFRVHYSDTALVGFGAVFERELPGRAFERFHRALGRGREFPPTYPGGKPSWSSDADAHFLRECDTVFTGLTPRILADVPVSNLPHATGPDRLYRQAEHVGQRQRMIRLVRQVRDS